jgi:hypothetical protein
MDPAKDWEAFVSNVEYRLDREGEVRLQRSSLEALAFDVEAVAQEREFAVPRLPQRRQRLLDSSPLQRAAYTAAMFLECQLFVMHRREAAG